jgi:hypothetical protein
MRHNQSTFLHLLILALVLSVVACGQQRANPINKTDDRAQGVVLKDVPTTIDAKANYLFYLHGRIIENKGIRPTDPRYGVYEYEEILNTLAAKGFTVISEARAKDTDVNQYATKVVQQINSLVSAAVPPRHITVVGASKGALITMRVSTLLKNKEVNFVIMSNCNDWVDQNFQIDLYGNVLSIYDIKDEFGQTCQKFFDKAHGLNRHNEVVLKVGTGHAVLYKPMKEWVDLVVEWAKQ